MAIGCVAKMQRIYCVKFAFEEAMKRMTGLQSVIFVPLLVAFLLKNAFSRALDQKVTSIRHYISHFFKITIAACLSTQSGVSGFLVQSVAAVYDRGRYPMTVDHKFWLKGYDSRSCRILSDMD